MTIFLTIFSNIFSFASRIFSYLFENPKILVALIVGICIAGISYNLGARRQAKIDAPIIKSYKDAEEQRQKKINELEIESLKAAVFTAGVIKETNNRLSDIQSAYVKEKGKNSTLVRINDARFKNGSLDVNIDSGGNLMCDDLGSEYLKSLNRMVEEGNKK